MKALQLCFLFSLFCFSGQATDGREREKAAFLREVKCPTCQGQSIADSNADAAREIRTYIEEEFQKGTSVKVIKETLVNRYGEDVLFEPPLRLNTALLWGFPFLIFGGFVGIVASKALRHKCENATLLRRK